MKLLVFNLFAFLSLFHSTFGQPSFIKDSLDHYINVGIKDWKVPGLAIVIVKDGKVILQKGYGVKDITSLNPVDENTLFFIASNSKLFTGTALAKLDFEKKLSLNDKITKYYPNYKLFDQTMSENVTIKDMLTHRIGTKTFQGDFTFWNTKLNSEEVMNRMKYLSPINSFRDAYGYCNSCFLTAGMIIPKAVNKSWFDYVNDEIVKPLKMFNTYVSSNGIEKKVNNIATPYTTSYTNELKPVPYDHWDNLAPAASIVSNVKDLSHWLLFQLDSGRYESKQIMPWSILQKTRDIQIITSSRKSALFPVHFRGYGLGVFSCDYNGRQVYWHTGGAGGMVSNVCFVPEEKLGIAILTNNDNQNFFELLRYQILDSYLNVPFVNRSQQQLSGHNNDMDAQVKEINDWKDRAMKQSKMALDDLKKYAGSYKHKLYGNLDIKVNGNYLDLVFHTHPDLKATMQYMGNDEWLLTYNNILYGIFNTKFVLKNKKVKGLIVKINEFVEIDPYEFEKS